MFNFVLMNDFALYAIILSFVLLVLTFSYYWFVYKPYAQFPACRLEHRIPYWILKRVPLNYAVFQTFAEHARKYESEGMFAVWIGMPFLLVYGEDIVKKIVTEPAAIDKPKFYSLLEYAMGKGIFTRNGETWKKHRKMTAPAFHVTSLKSYTTSMNEISEDMTERILQLNGQPTENIFGIVGMCVMRIIAATNLGEREGTDEEISHIIKVLHTASDFLLKRLFSPWLYFDFALKLFPSAREALKLVTGLRTEHLKPRLVKIKDSLLSQQDSPLESDSDLNSNSRRLKPFGESFVEQHLLDPTITLDEVARQLSIIIGAGFETVLYTVKYTLYLLGTHKDVQERAFEEVMSETEGHITYDDLRSLVYLESVIKETLRLYPPPIFAKKLNKDMYFGKYKIPKNATVGVFSYMLHRNPEIYPEPEKFNPERFMDKDSKIKPWSHVPFAEGLRPCIGKNFAMIQMKIMLAHIIRKFEIISLDRLEEKDIKWSFILECTKTLRMQFLPRKQEHY